MNKITKKKTLILIIIGMSLIAISQVISHYLALSDLTKGSFMGIGIGILLLAIIRGNYRIAA